MSSNRSKKAARRPARPGFAPFAPLAALAVIAVAVPATGQGGAPASPARSASAAAPAVPVMATLTEDIRTVERKLVALAEAIPADRYDWRPGEGVRSVAEVLVHVAADNYFIPTAAGTDAPAETGIRGDSYASVQAYEGRAVSKEQAIEEMQASFAHLYGVMEGIRDSGLGETMSMFGRPATGIQLWVLTATHLHEHLGQLIAYARTTGVKPPWSR